MKANSFVTIFLALIAAYRSHELIQAAVDILKMVLCH